MHILQNQETSQTTIKSTPQHVAPTIDWNVQYNIIIIVL